MIAGHDYLSLRLKIGSFWNKTRLSAATLLITGGILIGVGSAYYGYADDARANLQQYEAIAVEIAPVWSPPAETVELVPFSQAFLPEQSLYSGDAGVDPASVGPRLPEGFVLIDFSSQGNLPETAPAKWMSIGALDINSIVEELSGRGTGGQASLRDSQQLRGTHSRNCQCRRAGRGVVLRAHRKSRARRRVRVLPPSGNSRKCCAGAKISTSSPITGQTSSSTG